MQIDFVTQYIHRIKILDEGLDIGTCPLLPADWTSSSEDFGSEIPRSRTQAKEEQNAVNLVEQTLLEMLVIRNQLTIKDPNPHNLISLSVCNTLRGFLVNEIN